jgi:hypothetical protein
LIITQTNQSGDVFENVKAGGNGVYPPQIKISVGELNQYRVQGIALSEFLNMLNSNQKKWSLTRGMVIHYKWEKAGGEAMEAERVNHKRGKGPWPGKSANSFPWERKSSTGPSVLRVGKKVPASNWGP